MLYRRFGYLSSRLLLEKQDELRALEEQLDELDDHDTDNNYDRLFKRELQGEDRKTLLGRIESKYLEYGVPP